MIGARFSKWLQAPFLTGRVALLCAIVAVGLPTAVRAAVNGVVTGCEFAPYLPFVLLCAILLRWWQAGAVALSSVAILGGLFGGPPSHDLSCFLSAAGMFLGASAMMIFIAVLVRHAITTIQNRVTDKPSGGIVFSLEKGEVWASWYGDGRPVRLGPQTMVSHMMEDFLAQSELGDRLTGK